MCCLKRNADVSLHQFDHNLDILDKSESQLWNSFCQIVPWACLFGIFFINDQCGTAGPRCYITAS